MTRVHLWLVAGLIATGLGIIGAFLPLLPTTPFLLLAAFCFARSSPRLHAWLIGHPTYGPLIVNWEKHGAISLRAKVTAIVLMAASVVFAWGMGVPTWALIAHAAVLVCTGTFIITRPLPPKNSSRSL